jgi:hypothetical protein
MFGQIDIKVCVYVCDANLSLWADNISRTCVQECPVNSFADNSTQRCVQVCPSS